MSARSKLYSPFRVLRGGERKPRTGDRGTGASEDTEAQSTKPLRVVMVPDATAGNPYQRRLVEALQSQNVRTRLANPGRFLLLLGVVRASGGADVLHLHWTHRLTLGRNRLFSVFKSLRFLMELSLIRLTGTRVVWTAHNLLEHERRFPILELWVCRIAARLYDRIIVHGPEAGRVVARGLGLSGRAAEKIDQIPHGNFIGAYVDDATQEEARARLDIPLKAAPVFVHFGQIRPYKGVWQLLEAFERLERSDAVLLIAGKPWDEATRETLQAHARRDPRIRLFLGFVPDDDVQYFMTAADVVVLPYRNILTSGTAMLAMSFSRTIIMPAHGCSRDMMGIGNGIYYDAKDSDGLLRALQQAVVVDTEALGSACRSLAVRRDWDSIGASTAAVYRGEKVVC